MNASGILSFPLPDADARDRIQSELGENLLVEAGAGSGKTTELVNRMVALVSTGSAEIDRIAAVTFTRKAASELRERFQARLEASLREPEVGDDPDRAQRLGAALENIDRAFIGTIHAFCARLLRERPLEVGLDPGFEELPVEERAGFQRAFWDAFLERRAREADPVLEELSDAGLRPVQLYGLFDQLVENPDVVYPTEEASPPPASQMTAVRRELEGIVALGRELMPPREPSPEWDTLQKRIRRAGFSLDVTGWRRPADFFEALGALCTTAKNGHGIVLKRWKDGAIAKDLKARADAFGKGDTPARRLLDRWFAHRYALAIRLAAAAADEFAEYRRRVGKLDFQDLLTLAAELLRDDPATRRELGQRYRYLLVDEFQDTDPLQAEIMMLLASEPADAEAGHEAGPGGGAEADPESTDAATGRAAGAAPQSDAEHPGVPDWRRCVPRPGALFVVGDPKQSIYRFRRADIQLYELVKRRFEEFGGVLRLTSNFRSRPPIGDLVNAVFDDPTFFPDVATSEQAAFERLATRPATGAVPAEGVFWYGVHPQRDANAAVAHDDAQRLAAWIRDRVDGGERQPGDFLILTRLTRGLSEYARALEAQGLPVQVTGAGIGVEVELDELMTLLECMIDPSDPVKVVSVLVGLFFGLDHERLLAHRLAEGSFDLVRLGDRGHPDVMSALHTLRGWWRLSTREPADVFLGRVVPELGLLPFAAGSDLGALRAGALVYALDSVRAAALAGDASLPGALAALRAALALKEAEAPLQPGRPDVVRLMNLHQAKGLEGRVVVLADPSKHSERAPERHVERDADGQAFGYLRVEESRGGFGGRGVLARPVDWPEREAAESRFAAAEQVRLLYVAVTRAREELVVARWPGKPGVSAWSPLDPWLEEHAAELALEPSDPRPREAVSITPEDVQRLVREAAERIEAAGVPSYRHVSVTDVAKGDAAEGVAGDPEPVERSPREAFRGYSWGSVVHGALAVAAETDAESELRRMGRALLVEHGRPLDDHGEPKELDELVAMVRSVRSSELWGRAAASDRVMAEVPFAVTGVTKPPPLPPPADVADEDDEDPQKQLDLFGGALADGTPEEIMEDDEPEGVPSVLEGVIDLAFREGDGWVVADYKTDVGTDPDFPQRVAAYRRQVDLYAEAWARLTGEPVKERVLFFTTQGRVETW